MAFTNVQTVTVPSSGATTATTVSATVSAVGSGNCICGLVSWDHTAGITLNSITDNQGNTYNLETALFQVTDLQNFCAFSRTNITNAPTVITANFSSSVDFRGIIVDEFSGASTASSDERDAHGGQFQSGPSTATDAVTSGPFTTTVNGDLLYGAAGNMLVATALSPGTSFTGSANLATDWRARTEFRTQATAGSGTAATFTQGNTTETCTFLIAIKPFSGGADVLMPQIWM